MDLFAQSVNKIARDLNELEKIRVENKKKEDFNNLLVQLSVDMEQVRRHIAISNVDDNVKKLCHDIIQINKKLYDIIMYLDHKIISANITK